MNEKLVRILVIEDDPDIQKIAKMSLESIGGFSVKVCGESQSAVGEAVSFKPQLILLDAMMPGMDGTAVLKALRRDKACAGIAVVFLTAKVQSSEVENFRALGAADVIGKPFNPMTLPDKVKDIWKKI